MSPSDQTHTTKSPQRPLGTPGRSLFHIVLHQPEIPNNTGNIGRTCVATGCTLHLIHPIGFDIDEKACRRAGLDYWPRLPLVEHPHEADYFKPETNPPRRWLLTTRATHSVLDIDFQVGDHLVFGRESAGLPQHLLDQYPNQCVCLPMVHGERSLNLATAVGITIYLGINQLHVRNMIALNPITHRIES